MTKTVLVIAAHPDDEILGCGATMAKHVQNGDKVHVHILAEGMTSRDAKRIREKRKEDLDQLAIAAKKANDILGVNSLELHDLPDNRMDSMDRLDIVKIVEELIQRYSPSVLYTHHRGDVNIDHRRINDAIITACRPLPGQCVEQLLFFEVASSTEWQIPGLAPTFGPNWFVDVSETIETKLQALEAYEIEMRPWPHSRSLKAVEHQCRWRGASAGFEAAEAFVLGRQLIR